MKSLLLIVVSLAGGLLPYVVSSSTNQTCPEHCGSTSNRLPPISCPNHFQYLTEGDKFIGKLILSDLHDEETVTVDLQLSLHEFSVDKKIGNLSLWSDVKTVLKSLEERKPIWYRVEFSTQKELPKVTGISVNGLDICTADSYPAPSEIISLRHWFTKNGTKPKVIPPPNGEPISKWQNSETT